MKFNDIEIYMIHVKQKGQTEAVAEPRLQKLRVDKQGAELVRSGANPYRVTMTSRIYHLISNE